MSRVDEYLRERTKSSPDVIGQWVDYGKSLWAAARQIQDMSSLDSLGRYLKENMPQGLTGQQQLQWIEQDEEAMNRLGSVMLSPGTGTFKRIKNPSLRQSLRKMMQREQKARGKVQHPNTLSNVVRGTWYHGRKTLPRPGGRFDPERIKTGNLGEPYGISLTAEPLDVLSQHFGSKPPNFQKALQALQKAWGKRKQEVVKELRKNPGINALYRERQEIDDYILELDRSIHALDEELNKLSVVYEQTHSHKKAQEWERLQIQKRGIQTKQIHIKEKRRQLDNQIFQIEDTEMGLDKRAVQIKDNIDKLYRTRKFSRVMPQFGGNPESKVIPAWKAPETEWAQNLLKEAYVDSLKKQEKVFGPTGRLKQDWRNLLDNEKLNKDITKYLVSKGYKAVLYSPGRYEEYEMRWLVPDDLVPLDVRTVHDPGLKRLLNEGMWEDALTSDTKVGFGKKRSTNIDWMLMTDKYPPSLRDIYKDIDLKKVTRPPTPEWFEKLTNVKDPAKVDKIALKKLKQILEEKDEEQLKKLQKELNDLVDSLDLSGE